MIYPRVKIVVYGRIVPSNGTWLLTLCVSLLLFEFVSTNGAADEPTTVSKSSADPKPILMDSATVPGFKKRLEEGKQLLRLAEQAIDQRDFQRGDLLLRQALVIYKGSLGDNSKPYTQTLNLLGCVSIWREEYQQAEEYLQQALNNYQQLVGEDGAAYVDTLSNLAGLFLKSEDYFRAKPLLVRVLAARKQQYGEEHISYAGSLNNLGILFLRTNELDSAEPLFRQALEIYRKKTGDVNPAFADSLEKLGQLYTAKGDFLIAEQFLLRAVGTYAKTLPINHPLVAQGLESYSAMLRQAKRDAEAMRVESQANEIRESIRKTIPRLPETEQRTETK